MGHMVVCSHCYSILDETGSEKIRQPCPYCQSIDRNIYVKLEDRLEGIHDMLGYKVKESGKGKPIIESKSGDEQRDLDGKWLHKDRIIDRENDYYYELVVDQKTGRVIRYCKEKLSDHQGHGTDTSFK